MSTKKKLSIKIVGGALRCKDCETCNYATIKDAGNYVNCEIANGQMRSNQLQSMHGLVIKPAKDGKCDYYSKGRPTYMN